MGRGSRVYLSILNITKTRFSTRSWTTYKPKVTELIVKVLVSHCKKLQLVRRLSSSIIEMLSLNIYVQLYFIIFFLDF